MGLRRREEIRISNSYDNDGEKNITDNNQKQLVLHALPFFFFFIFCSFHSRSRPISDVNDLFCYWIYVDDVKRSQKNVKFSLDLQARSYQSNS